ncbi:MAG: ABC transporter substrate-binding protein [Acidimicrobiales bacterium]
MSHEDTHGTPGAADGGSRRGGPVLSRRDLLRGAAAAGVGVGLGSSLPALATSAGAAKSKFPINASKKSSTPTSITLWHSMTENNLTTLQNMTSAFNASQPHIVVDLVNQDSYTDTLTAYTTALSGPTSKLPDLVQWETELIQVLIDSQSVIPADQAIAADHYSLSDYVPSMVSFFKVDGTQWALPFNISSQVLYFDQNAFTKAGLDPSKPPATQAALRTAAQKIVSTNTAKYGMSLKLDQTDFEQWMALGDKTLVNKSNGRHGRATAATFDDALGKSIFKWWSGMLKGQLAQSTAFQGTSGYDNLLAIGSGIAPMTFDTSAALGTILTVLSGGQYPDVKLGVAPMVWPGAKRTKGGGVFVGGAGMFMVKKSTPATVDAAWQFVKYLTEPAQQATWAVGTGYVPVRKSATKLPTIEQAWGAVPQYKVAYDQLLASPTNPATAGYVSGAANAIDTAIRDGITAMSNGTPPNQALSQAAQAANNAISSYNERV